MSIRKLTVFNTFMFFAIKSGTLRCFWKIWKIKIYAAQGFNTPFYQALVLFMLWEILEWRIKTYMAPIGLEKKHGIFGTAHILSFNGKLNWSWVYKAEYNNK